MEMYTKLPRPFGVGNINQSELKVTSVVVFWNEAVTPTCVLPHINSDQHHISVQTECYILQNLQYKPYTLNATFCRV